MRVPGLFLTLGISLAGFSISSAAPLAAEAPALSLPQIISFDEGLEVRDAQGRVVRSAQAQATLRRLFVRRAYELVTTPALPSMVQVLSVLERVWNLSHGLLDRPLRLGRFWRAAVWAPAPKKSVLKVPVGFSDSVDDKISGHLLALQCATNFSAQDSLSSVVIRC